MRNFSPSKDDCHSICTLACTFDDIYLFVSTSCTHLLFGRFLTLLPPINLNFQVGFISAPRPSPGPSPITLILGHPNVPSASRAISTVCQDKNKMACLKGHTQVPLYAINFVGESFFKSLYLYTILFSWSKLHQGYVSRWLCLLYVSYTFAWAGNGMFPLGLGLAVEDNPFMYPHDNSCRCCQIFSSPFLSAFSP